MVSLNNKLERETSNNSDNYFLNHLWKTNIISNFQDQGPWVSRLKMPTECQTWPMIKEKSDPHQGTASWNVTTPAMKRRFKMVTGKGKALDKSTSTLEARIQWMNAFKTQRQEVSYTVKSSVESRDIRNTFADKSSIQKCTKVITVVVACMLSCVRIFVTP